MSQHEECFKMGDIITGPSLGSNVMVIGQEHQWYKVREIYRHGAEYFIDVVNKDFYRVFVGDF